jgi:hypothetical protein
MNWRAGDKRSEQPEASAPWRPVSLPAGLGALLALTFGGLIKFATFFFGPVVLAAALRRQPSWRARWRLILIGGCACLAFVLAAYVPFWAGWTTMRNVGDRTALFTATWLAAAQARLKLVVPEQRAGTIVAWASLALLLVGVTWAAWRAWRAPQDLARYLLWLVLWFLLVCNPWFQPWYVIWPLALVALQPWRTRAVVAVNIFCLTALASYVVGGLLLPALGLDEKSAMRELLISLFLYIPPLVVFGWERIGRQLARWRAWPAHGGEQRRAAAAARE